MDASATERTAAGVPDRAAAAAGRSVAEELAPRPRLARLAAAWALITLGGPGALFPGGLWWLGALGVAVWALAVVRPGRRALGVEWLVAGCAMGVQIWWIGYVVAATVPASMVVMGAYAALGGPLLRRLRGVFPRASFALLAPAAWLFAEGLQHAVPIPFSWGWMRLGHLAADDPLLIGSARVWGAIGLSAVVAGTGGAVADLALRRWRGALVGVAAWLGVAIVASTASAPPPVLDAGPRVLMIQPGIEMARKQFASTQELLDAQLDLTVSALESIDAAGRERPDLVVWAETMLRLPLATDAALEEIRAGRAQMAPWHGDPSHLLDGPRLERQFVQELVLGRLLPPGTAFVSGVEEWTLHEGELRRTNVGALWEAGRPRRTAPKTKLVIGGETAFGLDGIGFVRDFMLHMAGYIPDLLAGERTEVLAFGGGAASAGGEPARGPWHLAATVCFDNAFERPYTGPVRRERVDAHLVLSNEAWYRTSFEFDQMMAFSKVVAAATGRSVARCTNSGITAVIGPDGRERERLVVPGPDGAPRDRAVAGWLLAEIPVPAPDAGAPPYTAWGAPFSLGWAVLGLLAGPVALAIGRRRSLAATGAESARRRA